MVSLYKCILCTVSKNVYGHTYFLIFTQELDMPLIGCNQAYQYGNPKSHQWFAQFEAKGDHTMRYFIEPVREKQKL